MACAALKAVTIARHQNWYHSSGYPVIRWLTRRETLRHKIRNDTCTDDIIDSFRYWLSRLNREMFFSNAEL